jgi:hypothetical protein
VFRSICTALTLGGTGLGFDAILLIADFGQPTPEFTDKHLSYQWLDARWMYDTARALDVLLCAGFTCPSLGAGLTPEHTQHTARTASGPYYAWQATMDSGPGRLDPLRVNDPPCSWLNTRRGRAAPCSCWATMVA